MLCQHYLNADTEINASIESIITSGVRYLGVLYTYFIREALLQCIEKNFLPFLTNFASGAKETGNVSPPCLNAFDCFS